MKIAVPTKGNNEVDAHFGHCEYYRIFTISENKEVVASERMDSPQGCGCKSNVAERFKEDGITLMLAGGIGDGAVKKLADNGVEVIRNCNGDVDELVAQYLLGNVHDSGENCSAHGHECGEHSHTFHI